MADDFPGIGTNMQLEFFLDGQHVGYYVYNPDDLISDYTYNVSVYNNTSMGSGLHNFTTLSFGLLLFDYATYT